ncbi:MAG TPA: hypothetical protein VN426_06030 [Syntrophomonadaceae bacterium]|nr:hypothetical protein [Syntrophomonadaceae bacterium]
MSADREARSLGLERDRVAVSARIVRRSAPVLYQLQPTRLPPGSWSV